ncbi:hypothetical protein Hdeb2414_s0008g00282091 [Helianthus debilis subsp. tardiflorus]
MHLIPSPHLVNLIIILMVYSTDTLLYLLVSKYFKYVDVRSLEKLIRILNASKCFGVRFGSAESEKESLASTRCLCGVVVMNFIVEMKNSIDHL